MAFLQDFTAAHLQYNIVGLWVADRGKQTELVDAITGEKIAETRSGGLNFSTTV